MQVKTIFKTAVEQLEKAGIPEPELEVSLLLSHVLHMERAALLLAGEKILNTDQIRQFERFISRRLAREPLAYIIGEKEFWSLPFKVSKDVLIPRPETELLLEKSLERLRCLFGGAGRQSRILDLGTGSGVIAIVIALEMKNAKVTAVDRSYRALKVARHNAKKHKVAGRIDFINSNWFDAIRAKEQFDAVISNPPYVAREILAQPYSGATGSLSPEVLRFEPRQALDGGRGGIQEISRISTEAGIVLKSGGWLFLEIGADQEREVFTIFDETAAFENMVISPDYAGLPRVFEARKRKLQMP